MPIYREVVERAEGGKDFEQIQEQLASIAGPSELEWYWCYEGEDYSGRDFSDWVHLNTSGGRRYVAQLLRAVRDRSSSDWCSARQR
jgi:hypothetical protein